jgi:hypothetical protein
MIRRARGDGARRAGYRTAVEPAATEEAVTSTQPPDESQLPTVPPSSQPLRRQHPLGSGYLLLDQIGSGTGGRVYRATRRADGQTVAVKVLRAEYLSDPEMVTRFLREGGALRAASHPHLVRVLDLVAEGDTLAIVMDFVPGPDLRRLLATERLDQDRALRLLAQLAAALDAVHEAGIVHRDVKPENVLVVWRGGEPFARLTDFGVARILDNPGLTRISQVVGTPAYLAPELATGRTAGPAADVYALGVTAYELFTGDRPFAAESPIAVIMAHVEAEPARPPGMADAVWSLLRDCLAKDPAQRPTAARLAAGFEALHGHAGALPAGAPPPLPPTPPAPHTAHPAPPAPAAPRPDQQLTMAAQRPVPEAPATLANCARVARQRNAARRRRWPLVAALGTLALLGAGGGLWVGHARGGGGAAPPAASAAPAGHVAQIFLTIQVRSPKARQIRLDFEKQTELPGFDSYLVYQDGRLTQVPAGQAPPYLILDMDPRAAHCFRVAALVRVAQSVPPVPPALCHRADGRPTPRTTQP